MQPSGDENVILWRGRKFIPYCTVKGKLGEYNWKNRSRSIFQIVKLFGNHKKRY